uniref:Uncharacterized protein n=1 Tax=Ciona savignyi TaxID=51511 RepID=H2YM63_CIOSA
MLVSVLDELRQSTETKIDQLRDTIGFNLAALNHLRRTYESKNDVTFFSDATERSKEKKKKRKRTQRAVLTA